MSRRLLCEIQCDYMYGVTIGCTETIVVPTSSKAYGTDDRKERDGAEAAGWAWGNACKVYCPEHRLFMTEKDGVKNPPIQSKERNGR